MLIPKLKRWEIWIQLLGVIVLVLGLVPRDTTPPKNLTAQLRALSAPQAFNFFSWEVAAITRKVSLGLLAPQRFMDDTTQAQFVLHYLDQIRETHTLEQQITRIYANPEVDEPAQASHTKRQRLTQLRAEMRRETLVAETILGEQVSQALATGGFGTFKQMLPPVSGTFTPLPYILITSPRERIESLYQRPLVPGLTIEEQERLETTIETDLPSLSAYTTAIGGLAAYPAMLLENSSIDWLTNLMAHEWTHHYLIIYPLGWEYFDNPEARTINETTASLIGEWAGQEIMLKFYTPLLNRAKPLPDPLTQSQETEASTPPHFDFRAEMHETRVRVDEYLADGRIQEAEAYMETRRQYFVAHGYYLRRLNQAYFAFHGAYADQPGASGRDPIGPTVRQMWALSTSPQQFTQLVARTTTLAELQKALTDIQNQGTGQ